MKRHSTLIILLLTITFLGALLATSSAQDDVDELKKQIQALQQRVDELEARQHRTPSMQPFGRQWDPFAEMERMREEMERMFDNRSFGPIPTPRGALSASRVFDQDLELKESEKGYEIRFDLAGLDKEKMDIRIDKHSITISGQYSEEHRNEDSTSLIQSKRFGTFLKTIPLPIDADTSKVKTEQKEDELVITMPKK